jgi:hypothetical protein
VHWVVSIFTLKARFPTKSFASPEKGTVRKNRKRLGLESYEEYKPNMAHQLCLPFVA